MDRRWRCNLMPLSSMSLCTWGLSLSLSRYLSMFSQMFFSQCMTSRTCCILHLCINSHVWQRLLLSIQFSIGWESISSSSFSHAGPAAYEREIRHVQPGFPPKLNSAMLCTVRKLPVNTWLGIIYSWVPTTQNWLLRLLHYVHSLDKKSLAKITYLSAPKPYLLEKQAWSNAKETQFIYATYLPIGEIK